MVAYKQFCRKLTGYCCLSFRIVPTEVIVELIARSTLKSSLTGCPVSELIFKIITGDWVYSGTYSKEESSGNMSIYDPTFIFIVSGTEFVNERKTRNASFTIENQYNKSTSLKLSIDTIDVTGQFYANPRLNEDGRKATISLTYQF